MRTFSVGFEEESHDERAAARKAAEAFGARHHEIVFRADDLGAWLPRMLEHLGEPVGDPATIPTWLLSEFARREVTVALSGEGADELFGGYLRYRAQSRLGGLARMPGAGAALKAAARAPLPGRAGQALEALAETDAAANHLHWSSTVPWSLAARLFGDDAVDAHFALLDEQARQIRAERDRLFKSLNALKGIKAWSSRTNFILFRVERGDADRVFEGLSRQGVLIKNLNPAGGLLGNCLRVTVGTPEENNSFLKELEACL